MHGRSHKLFTHLDYADCLSAFGVPGAKGNSQTWAMIWTINGMTQTTLYLSRNLSPRKASWKLEPCYRMTMKKGQ